MTGDDKSDDGQRAAFEPVPGEERAEEGGRDPPVPLTEGQVPPTPPQSPPPTTLSTARSGQTGIGEVLNGRYRITRLIAHGRMGEVFEGEDIQSPGERVAIKVFSSDFARSDSVRAKLAKETSTLTRINHEAIVAHRLAAFDPWGRPFIAMDFIDGPSIEDRLGNIWLTDEQFGALAMQLASALGAAHRLGVIHHDIAPDNILLAGGDPMQSKIIDFSIALEETSDGFVGKFKYVAPEQLGEYDGNIGPWTDLYSLALTLLALASGRDAEMGGSIAEAVRKRVWMPDLSAIPTKYRMAFERALHPDPAMRLRTMDDFINLLKVAETRGSASSASNEVQQRPASVSVAPATASVSAATSASEHRTGLKFPKWVPIGLAGAVVLLVGGLGILLATGGDVSFRSNGGSEVDPETPEFAALAASLANEQACAWLTFDGATGNGPRFVGGIGNRSGAERALSRGLAGKGSGDVSLDLDEVVSFDQSLCGPIDALRQFRAEDDLVTSPQRTYGADEKDMILSNEFSLGQGMWAKPLLRVGGLRPDEDLVLIVIEAGSKMQPLFSGRQAGEGVVRLLSGKVTADGFEVPYPAKLEHPPKEGYGIAVIAGKGPFPVELFGDPNDPSPRVPLDADWPERFSSEARVRGWRTDIFWFSVADEAAS